PFGLLYDEKHEVIVVLDEDLIRAESVNFHPNVNTATLTIATADFLRFLKFRGNRVITIRF
ncbi:MAG TPA: YbaK/EbsC family protein, partial [Candidatus Aminicenantes bacterium]|nr:YbaK/EbsC family protein [Candidatus Aminicenantes bacterium]